MPDALLVDIRPVAPKDHAGLLKCCQFLGTVPLGLLYVTGAESVPTQEVHGSHSARAGDDGSRGLAVIIWAALV